MTEAVSGLFRMSVFNQGAISPHPGVICVRIGLLLPGEEVAGGALVGRAWGHCWTHTRRRSVHPEVSEVLRLGTAYHTASHSHLGSIGLYTTSASPHYQEQDPFSAGKGGEGGALCTSP